MRLRRSKLKQRSYDAIDALLRIGLHVAPLEKLALWWGYRYQPAPAIAKLRSGSLLEIKENDHLQLLLYYCGQFEPHCVQLMKRHIRAGSTVLDVGANIGVYTIEAAKAVGARGRVVAIEASPNHIASLEKNVALNGFRNVAIVSSAVGDADRAATLTLPDGANRGMFTLGRVAGSLSTTVNVRKIDDIVAEIGIETVNFIKMDIEGSELGALKGAIETLRRWHPAILIELNETALGGCGSSSSEIKSFLSSLNYKGSMISPNGLTPLPPNQAIHPCDECFFV